MYRYTVVSSLWIHCLQNSLFLNTQMSLGHWCFVCTVTCSLVFLSSLSWNMSLCRVSFFLELKKLQTEALEDCLNSLNVFFVSSNHWPGSLSTVELYCTTTAEHYGNCDCRNCWKDWAALSCHWPRIDWLLTGKIQPTGGKHTESARTGLRKCFSHWTVGANFGWVWGCGDQRLTVGHPSCHCCEDPLWDTEEHCTEPRMASFNCRAWQYDWWTVWNSLRDSWSRQPTQLFFTGSTAFSQMSELACTEDCGDTVSQLQDAALLLHTGGVQLLWQLWTRHCGDPDWTSKVMWSPLVRLHRVCALRPHWALPRRSWTLEWFLWNCSPIATWTTGSVQGLHCWDHCRSTGQVTLTHWMFRSRWHWYTSSPVHKLKSNWIDTEGRIEAYTAFNRLYLDHCWTTGSLQLGVQLNTAESRTGFGVQLELNCNKIFGLHCRGLVGHCILTVNQLELMHEDVSSDCAWLHLFTDEQLPKKTGSRLTTAHGETVSGTAKVDVKITGLPVGSEEVTVTITGHWDWVYPRDLWGNCFLNTAMLTDALKSWK